MVGSLAVSGGTAFGYRIRCGCSALFVFPSRRRTLCFVKLCSLASWCLCTAHATTRTGDQSVVGLAPNIEL